VAFPEKLLTEDEEVIEHLHPHWITVLGPVLVFLLVCALVGVGIAFVPTGNHLGHEIALIAIAVVAIGVLLRYSLGPVLARRSTHYVITTRRVLIRRGVLRHTGRDITLARINDVSYEQSLLDRLLRAGSVTIESAGDNGQERLANLPHADQVQQTLNRLIEGDATRD
jgi:uncharacterized membrane protein YdbT with pleckstrin-like domain